VYMQEEAGSFLDSLWGVLERAGIHLEVMNWAVGGSWLFHYLIEDQNRFCFGKCLSEIKTSEHLKNYPLVVS
jgi:hypothetical protein